MSTWEVPPSLQNAQARKNHSCVYIGNGIVVIYGGCTNLQLEPTHTILTYCFGI